MNEQAVSVEELDRWKVAARFRTPVTMLPVDILLDYGMDPFRFERQALCAFFVQMAQFLGLTERFALATSTVLGYADEVSLTYRNVPYHSFLHAFSVTQFLFTLCTTSELVSSILNEEELLAMFVASLAHDADHPGNNNAWEVATKSALAVRYSDSAVLEQHHAAVGMRIMSSDKRNMFGTLDDRAQEEARRTYFHAILATDMAVHSKMVDDIKQRSSWREQAFDRTSPADRRELTGVLLHSADISNPLLPEFALCRTWAERIKEEFWAQYNRELETGLPPTQMWASLGTNAGFYKSQVGFIDFIVQPLWNTIFEIFPDVPADGRLRESLSDNRDQWVKKSEAEAIVAATRS